MDGFEVLDLAVRRGPVERLRELWPAALAAAPLPRNRLELWRRLAALELG